MAQTFSARSMAGRVEEPVSAVGKGQPAHLARRRLGQLLAAVTDGDVPQGGKAVDVLAAAGVCEDGSFALDEDDGVARLRLQILGVDQVGDVALDQRAILALVHLGLPPRPILLWCPSLLTAQPRG